MWTLICFCNLVALQYELHYLLKKKKIKKKKVCMVDTATTKAIAFLSNGARRHEHKSPNAPHAAETTGKH